MRAVVLEKYGGPEVLRLRDVPDPPPGRHEVRVTVAATSVNRADVLQRMGKYPPPGPPPEFEIPGLDFAGTVEVVGPEVTETKPGDRVFGLLSGGGYASKVVTHEGMLLRCPEGMSFLDAAAVPEAFFTAWDALEDKARLRSGEIVLVHAAASGVGTAAVQFAKRMGASRVFATTRSADKARRLGPLGADRVIVTGQEDFAEAVLRETEGRGADVILDFVGADYLERNLRGAALEGRIVQISWLGGPRAEVSLATLMSKRLRLIGTTLRSRPIQQKMVLTQRFATEVLPHLAAGHIRPVIDRVFRLEEIADAHRYMEENQHVGKIVVTITP